MENGAKPGPGTIALAIFGALAALLYGWFLSVDLASDVSGDAVVGQAFKALTALGLFWIAVLVLLALDRVVGGPSWPRRAGFVLVPLAGIATTFATDYPRDRLCQLGIVGMPMLIGAYLLAGRLPTRRSSQAQAAILLPMAAFSAYSIQLFAS